MKGWRTARADRLRGVPAEGRRASHTESALSRRALTATGHDPTPRCAKPRRSGPHRDWPSPPRPAAAIPARPAITATAADTPALLQKKTACPALTVTGSRPSRLAAKLPAGPVRRSPRLAVPRALRRRDPPVRRSLRQSHAPALLGKPRPSGAHGDRGALLSLCWAMPRGVRRSPLPAMPSRSAAETPSVRRTLRQDHAPALLRIPRLCGAQGDRGAPLTLCCAMPRASGGHCGRPCPRSLLQNPARMGLPRPGRQVVPCCGHPACAALTVTGSCPSRSAQCPAGPAVTVTDRALALCGGEHHPPGERRDRDCALALLRKAGH